MKTKNIRPNGPLPKKSYQPPKLKVMGNVQQLTLKTGSNVDGFGGHI